MKLRNLVIIRPINMLLSQIMKINYFTFSNTRSEDILNQLWIDYFVVDWKESSLKNLTSNNDFIIWFWDYSWRDLSLLKIESRCDNEFRNSYLDINQKVIHNLYIPDSIDPNECRIWTNWMGNGYCNKACYELCKKAENEWVNVAIIFVHIPNNISFECALSQISQIISYLNYSITTSL